MTPDAPNDLDPQVPAGLPRVRMPVRRATDAGLEGLGFLVDDPERVDVEIVRWPARGWRPVDPDSGDEGGVTVGVFYAAWKGDVLYGRNGAVGGHYLLAWATDPGEAREDRDFIPERMLLWHANYHPDGGQLFFPLEPRPFVVPLAPPGDDVRPEDFVCWWFDGSRGLYIHPDVWHEGVFPVSGAQRFHDVQGAVHARVSVDLAREFGVLLEAGVRPDHET